ncbi:DUF6493 family protein [Kitasatospora brasiliensis]|uniref:DUF6493 family protein n=1 Tax=Kitasatospora brasiliensis TaxID=3058040 RepID=UPI002930579F|nr:DUF6493 family protein [Kitasatospora sp. K002]
MTDRTSETISWDEVRALIAARVPQGVIDRLSPLPVAELRHLRAPLRGLRTELSRELSSRDNQRYRTAYDQLAPLHFAGILSAATPAEAHGWLTARRLLTESWLRAGGGGDNPDFHTVLLALIRQDRDAAYHRELAVRLAEWLPARGDHARWFLAHGLAVWSGADLPATDGYLTGWVHEGGMTRYPYHREIGGWFADQGLREPVPHHDTLLSWLRDQPRTAEFVRRLFDVPDVGTAFADPYAAADGPDHAWPTALTALAAEGVLDRAELIDRCLGRLLRGDRPGNLRGFLRLYAALAPDTEELLARAHDLVRLAAEGAPGAAKAAQTALRSVDGRLPADLFGELTAGVLARSEKALATTQLTWADAVLRRGGAAADDLLPALAAAFIHPAPAVRERALGLVARHLPDAAPATAETVRAAAGGLGPALRPEARRLLALPDLATATAQAAAALPAAPAALPAAPAGPLDLAERFGALMADRIPDPGEFETVLAALVAEHHRDAAALRSALAPLAARRVEHKVHFVEARSIDGALGCLLDALTGRPHESGGYGAHLLDPHAQIRSPAVIPVVRVHEAAHHVADAPVPLLLATPTAGDGTIDPAVLVERLAAYRAVGARPWPADLAQALLRTDPGAVPAVRATAAAFGWDLPADTPLPAPDGFHTQTADQPEQLSRYGWVPATLPRIVPLAATAARVPEGITGLLHFLPDPTETGHFTGMLLTSFAEVVQLSWLAPWHPETVAAHGLPAVVSQAGSASGFRAANPLLPGLAQSPGEFGTVGHLALAYGLTAVRADHRTAALDALLALAARGRLRPEVLGDWLTALWRLTAAKPNRFLPVLADAARSGAGREVWAVLATVITALVSEPGRRGLADTLALAADCAAAEGIHTPLPALDTLTTPPAPTRVRTEAARLARLLTP